VFADGVAVVRAVRAAAQRKHYTAKHHRDKSETNARK
jgi:hypothetical protein